jgi:tetratricopeptide (TPR) repeat protein
VAAFSLAVVTTRYLPHWRDSVALRTRALYVDPRNDVALYNLALALEENGDADAALGRYEELLRLIPDHAPARHNRDRLEARRLEGEAGALAQSGRLAEAIDVFSLALLLDPQRLHSRRSRGMALASSAVSTKPSPTCRPPWRRSPSRPWSTPSPMPCAAPGVWPRRTHCCPGPARNRKTPGV